MGVLALPPGGEQLTLAGVDMFTPAWSILNSYVMEQPPAIEVENTDIAGYDGVRAEQPWQVETVHTLSLHVIGDVDHTTTPHPDPLTGVRTNWRYLTANVFDLMLTQPTISAVWEPVPGDVLIASDAQVRDAQINSAGPADFFASFELVLPTGWESGS